MIKQKRLSKKEYDGVLRIMRQWPSHLRDVAAKLVWHIQDIEKENADLKRKIDKHLAPTFFEKPEPMKSPQYREYLAAPQNEREPLYVRLKKMIDAGETHTTEWNLTLKWNSLTTEEAFALAESNPLQEPFNS